MSDGQPTNEEFPLRMSEGFEAWLATANASLVFAMPPAKLMFVGLDDAGGIAIFERTFDKAMGIAHDAERDAIYVGTRREIWKLQNVLTPGERTEGGHDRLYVPMRRSGTGYINVHDLGVQDDGRVVMVNTRFGCLAEMSDTHSFKPTWWPPFLPGPAPNDRCHLNGLAMRHGVPDAVTTVSTSTEVDGWRAHRRDGGTIIDVASGETVCTGLSMPHSPRWHGDDLWVANAGTGELGRIDAARGRFEPVAPLPGFARGLCFVGDHAVVGTSKPRHGDIYSGLALDDRLSAKGWPPRLGIFVVDLRSGEVIEWLQVDGAAREIFEVMALPGVRRPSALGLTSDEVTTHFRFVEVPA